jgi:hypothetical protein
MTAQLRTHRLAAGSVSRVQELKAGKQIFRMLGRSPGAFELANDLMLLADLLLNSRDLCLYL